MLATIVWLIALLVFSVLVGTNFQYVELKYIFDKAELPLAVVIIISVFIGVIITTFLSIGNRARQSAKIKQLTKKLDQAKREAAALLTQLDQHEALASEAAENQYNQVRPEEKVSDDKECK